MPRGRGNGSYLDADPVEPGVLARWAHQGAVGPSVPHQQLQADEAGGVVLQCCLHCLLWAVLPAEGPEGKRKGMGEVGSAGAFPSGGEEGRGAVKETQALPSSGSACDNRNCHCVFLPCLAVAGRKRSEAEEPPR